MFILRRITSERKEVNIELGSRYYFIDQERNPEDYQKALSLFNIEKDNDIYGFIHYGENSIEPLYKKSVYFVMSDSGKTFANISYSKSSQIR